jgi:hypothetical protein
MDPDAFWIQLISKLATGCFRCSLHWPHEVVVGNNFICALVSHCGDCAPSFIKERPAWPSASRNAPKYPLPAQSHLSSNLINRL